MATLNLKGKLLDLSTPIVMGILNITPDSFFDGGSHEAVSDALRQTERMLEEGATIIDVGGMSSRPGAKLIDTEKESNRVLPVVSAIASRFPEAIISVDTVKAQVADLAIQSGAHLINDISCGTIDEELWPTIARHNVPYVLMHMQGKPNTMQKNPTYKEVELEILDFFVQQTASASSAGIQQLIIDPGFGFGKTIQHNYKLLKDLHIFNVLDFPVLVGLSRKSMIYKVLETTSKEALNGTTALHMVALQQGAKILRAHDVKEATETIKLWECLK